MGKKADAVKAAIKDTIIVVTLPLTWPYWLAKDSWEAARNDYRELQQTLPPKNAGLGNKPLMKHGKA